MPATIAASFNQLLKDVQGKPEQHVLEQLGIRTMAKARYTAENVGHYGLGFEHYCHFTSPIRRYPDVLVHRTIFSLLKGQLVVDKKMEEKCKHAYTFLPFFYQQQVDLSKVKKLYGVLKHQDTDV